jgi:hypothetical protein
MLSQNMAGRSIGTLKQYLQILVSPHGLSNGVEMSYG